MEGHRIKGGGHVEAREVEAAGDRVRTADGHLRPGCPREGRGREVVEIAVDEAPVILFPIGWGWRARLPGEEELAGRGHRDRRRKPVGGRAHLLSAALL